jgi:hypothetical protein
MATVPLRAAPVFAATLRPTDPLPVPDAPDVTVIHGTPLTAVHEHAAVVVTATVGVLALASTFAPRRSDRYEHGATNAALREGECLGRDRQRGCSRGSPYWP